MKKSNLLFLIFGLILLVGFVSAIIIPEFPECGNGIVEDGEDCDSSDTEICSDCNYTYLGDGIQQCQNGEGVCEECDGTDLGGQSCEGQGYDSGSLSCDSGSFDTSECLNGDCGNGNCDSEETCLSCPSDCGSCCGNGTIDDGEDCDDGNDVDDDDCPNDCTVKIKVYLDPKYIDDTEKYRDFTPSKITPFDDIICEVSKSKAGSSGKLLTVDDSGAWNTMITSGTFDSEGKWRINGWNYDGSAGGLGSGPAWTSNDAVIGQIFKTEKVRCEVVGESDLVADSSDEGWAHKYTACPFYADLGGPSLGDIPGAVREMLYFCNADKFNNDCGDFSLDGIINLYGELGTIGRSSEIAFEDIMYDKWLNHNKQNILDAAEEFGVDPKMIAAIGLTEFNNDNQGAINEIIGLNSPSIWSEEGRKQRKKEVRLAMAKTGLSKIKVFRNGVTTFGNMHTDYAEETMCLIKDIVEGSDCNFLKKHNPQVFEYNGVLKTMPQFKQIVNEDASELMTRNERGRVRLVAAGIAAMSILWKIDSDSNGMDISKNPGILGSLYVLGWVDHTPPIDSFFDPKTNPEQSKAIPFSKIIDGKGHGNMPWAESTKRFYNSPRLDNFFKEDDLNLCEGSK